MMVFSNDELVTFLSYPSSLLFHLDLVTALKLLGEHTAWGQEDTCYGYWLKMSLIL